MSTLYSSESRFSAWAGEYSETLLLLPSVACISSIDLQHHPLSDSYAGDRLPLALRATAVAPASAARPGAALLCYPARPSHRDLPPADAKPGCGPDSAPS